MDKDLFDGKLDYHRFLYEQLTNQVSAIEKVAHENSIDSFETLLANELIRDSLLLKFIILQRTVKKVGAYIFESRYKINLKSISWLEAEYFDQNCVIHYDSVWLLLQNIKPLKRQFERIKKYDDKHHTNHGEEVRCSFCGKSQQDVARMIAGPHEAICDECVRICSDVLVEVSAEDEGQSTQKKRAKDGSKQ